MLATYSAILGSLWISGLVFYADPAEDSIQYFREEISVRYKRNIEELPSLIMMPYHPVDGSIRWSAWGLTFIQTIISSVQYGVMIFCGWSMYTKMDQTIKTMSKNAKQLHQQLFKVLVIQLAAPTIFLLTPLSFIIYLPFFDLELSIPTGSLLCSFTIYVAIDSIIVMTVVTEYRKSTRKLLLDSLIKLQKWLTSDNGENAPKTTTFRMEQLDKI
ncbi:hypothetical protein GCK72_025482 [Caenorhabditis remanei]|uniref:Uncharacterized protein n=1 Tax=Caenorhabditis remanei TaxID=31234 RepID=A0A6A5G2T4_CAERE|nr:hypothetical protein GCK72_025482 [Caenorhabditis remanei]KAF1749015.1 hypothetical protein GCK72_025482 [Caenorhabditis remanei]